MPWLPTFLVRSPDVSSPPLWTHNSYGGGHKVQPTWTAVRAQSAAMTAVEDDEGNAGDVHGRAAWFRGRSGSLIRGEPQAPHAYVIRSDSITSSSTDLDAEFYEYSTLHGISDIYRSRNWCMRILWLIIFFGAVIASFYGCGGIIAEYLEKPVVVSYFVQEPTTNTLEVPDIVVCPFNRFNRSFFIDLNISDDLAQYLELSFPSPPIHQFQKELMKVAISKIDQHDAELSQVLIRLGNLSYEDFLERASLHCSAFILEPVNCSAMETVLTSAGKCVRVPGTTQSGAGYGYGKRVVVRLTHTLFNPGVNQLLNNGIAVKLAARGKGLNHDLMFVPAGSHAILPLKATQYMFMNDPPRYTCEKNLQLHYSRQNCFDSCLIEKAEQDCNCRLAPSGNRVPKLEICTAFLFYTCFFQKFFNSQNHQETMCRLRCLPPCEYWEYTGSMSYAKFPSPEAKAFITNASELEALEQTIILNVFFEQLEYTLIKHVVAMTPVSFIAQLGGQISLFVGGSIMTIFQLIIYGAHWLWRLRNGKYCPYRRGGPVNAETAKKASSYRESEEGGRQTVVRSTHRGTYGNGGRKLDDRSLMRWDPSAPPTWLRGRRRLRASSFSNGRLGRSSGGDDVRKSTPVDDSTDGRFMEDEPPLSDGASKTSDALVAFCRRNPYANGMNVQTSVRSPPHAVGSGEGLSVGAGEMRMVAERTTSPAADDGLPPYFASIYADSEPRDIRQQANLLEAPAYESV